MENNHDIDKKFSEASQSTDEPETFPSFEKVWEKIEEKLEQKDQKKRILPVWFPYGIAASLLIGFGVFYSISNKGGNSNVPQNIEATIAEKKTSDQNNTIAQSESIQKIDEIIQSNIQEKVLEVSPVEEMHSVASVSVPLPVIKSPVFDVTASEPPVAAMITRQKSDSMSIKNIEEVIAMGIKKEKNSVMSSTSMLSSDNINSVTDTAQVIPSTPFDRKDPVAVLGYSKAPVRMKSFNKNIATEKIAGRVLTNSQEGKIGGLAINSVSGNTVSIRGAGLGSLNEDKTPLYIIDGKISDSEGFKKLDPNKIVAINVLKSQPMVAIYGSKALNGVYLVETKDISKKEKKKVKELIKIGSAEKKDNP